MKEFFNKLFHSDEFVYRALRTFLETFIGTFVLTITATGFVFSKATLFAAASSALSVAVTALINMTRKSEA